MSSTAESAQTFEVLVCTRCNRRMDSVAPVEYAWHDSAKATLKVEAVTSNVVYVIPHTDDCEQLAKRW